MKQNLNAIFAHGFSTKKNNDGFSLHDSANYISEMNGNIWAESEGKNRGAAFIIEIPINK